MNEIVVGFVLVISVAVLWSRFPVRYFYSTMLATSSILICMCFYDFNDFNDFFQYPNLEYFATTPQKATSPSSVSSVSSVSLSQEKAQLTGMFDIFTMIPIYAKKKIGTSMDHLITTMRKSIDPSSTVIIDPSLFKCPDAKEPFCDGDKVNRTKVKQYSDELSKVQDMMKLIEKSTPLMSDKLAHVLAQAPSTPPQQQPQAITFSDSQALDVNVVKIGKPAPSKRKIT